MGRKLQMKIICEGNLRIIDLNLKEKIRCNVSTTMNMVTLRGIVQNVSTETKIVISIYTMLRDEENEYIENVPTVFKGIDNFSHDEWILDTSYHVHICYKN